MMNEHPGVVTLDAQLENTWIRKNDLPRSMTYAEACAYEDVIYVFYNNYVYEYNPETDSYTTRKNSPLGSYLYHRAIAYDGYIYVLSYSGFYRYYPPNDEWTTLATPTTFTRRYGSVFVEYDGEFYTFGSCDCTSYAERYNVSTNTWTRIADMPIATGYWSGVVLDDECHMIGGEWGYGNLHLIYNFTTNKYTQKTMPNSYFTYSRTEVIGDVIYAIGGHNNYKHCYAYVDGTWVKKADVPVGIDMFASATINGYIYTFGGDNYSSRVYQYYTGWEGDEPSTTTFFLYEINEQLYKEVEGELVLLDGATLCEDTMIKHGTHTYNKDLLSSIDHIKLHLYEQDPTVVSYYFNYTLLYKGQTIVQEYDFTADIVASLTLTAKVNANDVLNVLLSNDSGQSWYTVKDGVKVLSSLENIAEDGMTHITVNNLTSSQLSDIVDNTGKLRVAIYMKQAKSSLPISLDHIRLSYIANV